MSSDKISPFLLAQQSIFEFLCGASQRDGSRFDPHLVPFCKEFAGSQGMRGFSPGTPASSHRQKNMHVRLIGVSKIVLRSECVVVCLVCLCVAL